jgi:hypothetical protein
LINQQKSLRKSKVWSLEYKMNEIYWNDKNDILFVIIMLFETLLEYVLRIMIKLDVKLVINCNM